MAAERRPTGPDPAERSAAPSLEDERRDLQRESTPGSGYGRRPPLSMVLTVAAGGAVGAALRHAFALHFPAAQGRFPMVTFWENVTGAFLLGIVLIALLRSAGGSGRWRVFLATGVLGSFTTFSNVSLQIFDLASGGHALTAAAYAAASLLAGLTAALLGIGVGGRLLRAR